jgi:hypothetical protein
MHNIRPAKALNVALETQNPVYLVCFFHKKNPLTCNKISVTMAMKHAKNNFSRQEN